jgi:anti-anti-sigma factor
MHITAEPRDHYTILHLRGEFDTFYCKFLEREVDALVKAGSVHVALNLRLVKFINSTALGQIIKTSKLLGSHHGKLVLLRPSPFCKDIIEKVGIDRVVPIYMSDEEAAAALAASPSPAVKGHSPADLTGGDESAVLFTPTDESRVEHFIAEDLRRGVAIPFEPKGPKSPKGGWNGIGRMASLDRNGLRFTWGGGNTGLTAFEMAQFLAIGTELRIKFSLSLLKKGMVEAIVTVTEVEERPDSIKVRARFAKLDEDVKKAIDQYAQDLAFLKSELGGPGRS